jgi:HK97 family phage major capsid protein
MADKTLQQNRPLERGQTHKITVATKDIVGVSRTFPESLPIVAGGPRIPLGVQNLIPITTTTAGSVQYLREVSFTNNAAAVAEGAAKPKSDKVFEVKTLPIEVIAHYFKVTRQSWEDLPQLASQIESNGIYGLSLVVDALLLKGTGTPPQPGPGLYTIATAAAAVPAGTNMIDRLFLATAELSAAGWSPNGIVMNAADLAQMMILKATPGGQYIYTSSVPLPRIVTSPALSVGQFLVGDFNQARVFLREDSHITVATTNEDDFVKNMVTALAETRLALAALQASAFRKEGTVGP